MPANLSGRVSEYVHEPTQTEGSGVDLTVGSVAAIVGPGRVDFGGGELEPPETEPLTPKRRDPDDDYGWWDLAPGTYLLEYNERLSEGPPVTLSPRTALVELGASHPTLRVQRLPRMPLSVGDGGLQVKENARISTLREPEG